MTTQPDLLDLLAGRTGIICAVGAGGKKSVLQHLAIANPGRVALTASITTTYYQERLGFGVAIADETQLPQRVAALHEHRKIAYARPIDKVERRGGVSGATIERIHAEGGFSATYVKADGARMRWIKAPADDEPVIPSGCTTVIPVLSALAIGQRLTERVAHRIDRVQRVTGLGKGETIGAEHLGRLLGSRSGLLKDVGTRKVVPLINMVDDAEREKLAREAAERALSLSRQFDYVVLACLARRHAPVVAVVAR